jgi:hypothetical protein
VAQRPHRVRRIAGAAIVSLSIGLALSITAPTTCQHTPTSAKI